MGKHIDRGEMLRIAFFLLQDVECQFCYDIMSIRKQGEADEESNTDRRIRL